MTQRAISKKLRVWFICHRAELIFQTSETFEKLGIDHSFVASGLNYQENAQIYICSIDTLKRRVSKIPSPDLCIWDEAHHIAAAGWAKVKDVLDKTKHVGLSATPQRLDGAGLSGYFEYMVLGPSVEWLIHNKYLSAYKAFTTGAPDLSGVHSRFGDYKKSELSQSVDKPPIIGDIVRHWKKHARSKKTIVFAVSVQHSMHIAEQFRGQGIVAAHLDGNTDRAQRRDTCKAFACGDIEVLCNVDLFGEGFDIAAQASLDVTVECVVLARPTQSTALYLQQVGRSLRPKKTPAIILDHAGNCLLHGLPDEHREWSLEAKKSKKSDEQDIPIKQCEVCFHVHRPSKTCPECGHEYQLADREILTQEGELVEIDTQLMKRQAKEEQSKAVTLDALIKLGVQRGYKNPARWAAHVWTARKKRYA